MAFSTTEKGHEVHWATVRRGPRWMSGFIVSVFWAGIRCQIRPSSTAPCFWYGKVTVTGRADSIGSKGHPGRICAPCVNRQIVPRIELHQLAKVLDTLGSSGSKIELLQCNFKLGGTSWMVRRYKVCVRFLFHTVGLLKCCRICGNPISHLGNNR